MIGLVGSLHCIGMCSPLVTLVSGTSKSFIVRKIIYNLSRIVPYALLGAIAGTFGSFLHFPQIQFWLTVGFGILLIVIGISGTSYNLPFVTTVINRIVSKIKTLFSIYLSKKTYTSVFILGMLNGFIPCGLTYVAASYCILLPSAIDGILFMVAFGVGTFPAMIGFPLVITKLSKHFSFNLKKVITVAIIILGCSVIVRAAIIDYPSMKKSNGKISVCK